MEKLSFTLEFQASIIRFTLNDDNGLRVLDHIRNQNFVLIEHSVIFYTIEKVFKRTGRITAFPLMSEALENVFTERTFEEGLSEEDRKEIRSLLKDLYDHPAKDGDLLLEEIAKFGSFTELKDVLERLDLTNFESYNGFSSSVQAAIDVANVDNEEKGIFLIKGIKDRQMRRQEESPVIAMPWYQANRLSSAGGYGLGSVIVIMDRPKRLKTFALIQFARGYMRMKKKVLFIDLENGEDNLAMRLEQSVSKLDKKTLLSGKEDKKVQKVLRRYKRMGGEVHIRRLPAASSTNHIQAVIDEMYREYGIKFDILIIDYIALMGALNKSRDMGETSNIGQSYVDVSNLALRNKFEHVITAQHVIRSAYVRSETCYVENDVAKSVDIIRHAHVVYGLNRTPEEEEAGIVRLEVIAQRDGTPKGRAYFFTDVPIQRWTELTRKQVKEVEALKAQDEEQDEAREYKRSRGDT